MAWIINEDQALKRHLQGVTVSDDRAAQRPVQVKFGMPDAELSSQQFPLVVIDLIDIAEATERRQSFSRGPLPEGYEPEGLPTAGLHEVIEAENPDPYDLTYQIAAWSRHPRHDRQLLGVIGGELLPVRFGTLYVPQDGTARRLDRVGFAKRDTTDETGKRLFRNVWTVRVSSELWPYQLQALRLAYSGVKLNDPAVVPTPPAEFGPFTPLTTLNLQNS